MVCAMHRVFFPAALALCVFAQSPRHQRQQPPAAVDPGPPPADAVVLFDGKDLLQWTRNDGTPTGCAIDAGEMLCKTGAGDAYSLPKFRDAQIHLEFKIPYMPDKHGQERGNSGVYLQGKYEIQVLDSFNNPTYANGSCGALYGQAAPLVDASRPPEQWQTYDIIFRAPMCENGEVRRKARVTVLQNGVLIQDHVPVRASQCGEETGPLMLQDHNYPGAPTTMMRFRNIWLRPLSPGTTGEEQ